MVLQFPRRGHPQDIHRRFNSEYRAWSVSVLCGNDRRNIEQGNKILLPPSALDSLSRLHVTYPMVFKVTNRSSERETHCGVLEFSATEGMCFLPYWMMKHLCLGEGDYLFVENTQLPVGNFAKFQAQSVDFLDITNHKAVLENSLRRFGSLTSGETITIEYNNKQYELRVLETRPGSAIDIHECDLNVEFVAPVGYQEPEAKKTPEEEDDFKKPEVIIDTKRAFNAFDGSGNRVDGKAENGDTQEKREDSVIGTGIPDYRWKLGQIKFIRKKIPEKENKENAQDSASAFAGEGNRLKPRES